MDESARWLWLSGLVAEKRTEREAESEHDCESCPTCGKHEGRHNKCCGCYDGACCKSSGVENEGTA